jgi:LemA protein
MVIYIILGVLAVMILWAVSTYNGLVRLRALVDEAWSGIEVQLKRRFDLIPNLVETVKGYSLHEKTVLENVTKMRSMVQQAHSMSEKIEAETGLTQALRTLFAVAENYPDLKANENFLKLQDSLASIEHELQLSRRYYNGTVRNYNMTLGQFPSNMIANMGGFKAASYFEVSSAQERETPKVQF